MDAAARAELEGLRRRAFGPDADIQGDPAALARLIELEELAHPHAGPVPAVADPDVPAPDPVVEPTPAEPEPEPEPETRPPRVRGVTLIIGAIATVAVAIAVLLAQSPTDPVSEAAPTAAPTVAAEKPRYVFTADPHTQRLFSIRHDLAYSGYIDLPSETPTPTFPATTTLRWTTPLGQYYGWELWIAGGAGAEEDEHCVLIQRETETRARCVDAEGQRLGTLRVSLAGGDIPADEIREPMSDDQRIRFWWLESGTIDVVLGSFDND